jgi:ABC-type amino acid transport substrate-binding protein
MGGRVKVLAFLGVLGLVSAADLLACGDKFLVAGRGTRYQRPKNARAANVLIYADPASGLPETVKNVPVDALLKREGHQTTTVATQDQLVSMLTGGRFDVVLVANTVLAAVRELIAGKPDAPELVAFCVKPASHAADAGSKECAVKAPPKERSLLEAIDKAVLTHDRNARKAAARG